MHQSAIPPEERFAALVEAFLGQPGITPPDDGPRARRSFGSSALKIHDKIFAMLSGGRLVLKLPRQRVDALVAAGAGERFDPRRDGRLMKEWVVIEPDSVEAWLPLAKEAMQFVGTKRRLS